MDSKRADFAIINRSFWPIYPVIGEALLQLSEELSTEQKVCVILQDHVDIRAQLSLHDRGRGVDFYPCRAFSVSGSSVFKRIFDAIFFMVWVFFCLVIARPKKVYVSTDPPVLVPFIVYIYCLIFRSSYVYHLQDIHPEAANTVIPINRLSLAILKKIDTITLVNANKILTISDEMADELCKRDPRVLTPKVITNPAVDFSDVSWPAVKINGFAFCGNAGRLQRIPLIAGAIEAYIKDGGTLKFAFAGAGIYSGILKELAERNENVKYFGRVSAKEAAQINIDYSWALLPIEDEVTRYAFPSKSSSYVFSGALVAAVCGEATSVAQWVRLNNLGVVIAPNEQSVCNFFWQVQRGEIDGARFDVSREQLKCKLDFSVFIKGLRHAIFEEVN